MTNGQSPLELIEYVVFATDRIWTFATLSAKQFRFGCQSRFR